MPALTNKVGGCYAGKLRGKPLLAHRVVWFLAHGEWPSVIDHIDGDGFNNRLDNLRNVTQQVNMHNQSRRGYHYSARAGKYIARITLGGKQIHVGTFGTAEEAHAAYLEAKKIHHPTAPERCYA